MCEIIDWDGGGRGALVILLDCRRGPKVWMGMKV